MLCAECIDFYGQNGWHPYTSETIAAAMAKGQVSPAITVIDGKALCLDHTASALNSDDD